MVVITPTLADVAPSNCELKLDSGRCIQYVAACDANPRKRVSDEELPISRKNSNGNEQREDWEGVNSLCHSLDNIVEVEMETDFFEGKTVLEIGFSTGLPSVYAFENGASEISIHTLSKTSLQLYCKPTLQRNNIPANKCKYSFGNLDDLRKALGGKRFDVILAPDLLNRSESEFEALHDILIEAMADGGICLFSCFTYYPKVDGTLAAFLALLKSRREFDALERWTSPKTDIIQRKVYQVTRSLF
ncbi:unnamed protein product [Caenorhabditis auriculariae]|uniref:Uncharacterized protein n=1 Tax=Caenorhabditis auriculariae TaxID=2777116 RepID=A0A8S1GXW5_9PELO|nr:unnamed protein product [Caenorhabditis auriculariae]